MSFWPFKKQKEKKKIEIGDIYPEILRNGSLNDPHTGETDGFFYEWMAEINKICRPKNVLEVGFNRGASSICLLLSTEAYVTSIDIRDAPKSVSTIKMLFGDRFEFVKLDSQDLNKREKWKSYFDFIWIDGNHTRAFIESDTRNALFLEPQWILYDDFLSKAHSQDIKEVTSSEKRLKFIKEYSNEYSQAGCGLFLVMP